MTEETELSRLVKAVEHSPVSIGDLKDARALKLMDIEKAIKKLSKDD